MKVYGIIPARYASTRFPGKALADVKGKSMIQRVYEQASKSKQLIEVVVATDDERIRKHVEDFGGKATMTDTAHQSGTDRCAEVAAALKDADIIINIQGDEPYFEPAQIDELLQLLYSEPTSGIATLAKKITDADQLNDPNIVKVVISKINQSLYFSRQPLPFQRDVPFGEWLDGGISYYKHIGLYAFRMETLERIAKLKPTPLELAEKLEQLRWLERGFNIAITTTEHESFGIDTPEDLKDVEKWPAEK